MPDRRPSDGQNKLSPQTLVVASLSSLTAAIVTSHFWQGGTPITAAITPVIVALASELYSRPARRITELSQRAGTRTPGSSGGRERVLVPPERPVRRLPAEPPAPGPGEVRIYRSESASRRRIHPKVVIATAAVAFLIAAVVLTVPELVFGGSVASHGKTTFFGGHTHKHKQSTNQQPTQTAPSATTTAPTTTAPAPTTTAPPAQTVPQTTTPATPPPTGGTPAPQGATTP